MKKVALAITFVLGLVALAIAIDTDSVELNKPLAVVTNKDMYVGDYKNNRSFSVQVDYSQDAPATVTAVDGAFSSTTLTVVNYAGLHGQQLEETITINGDAGNTAMTGKSVTVNGKAYTEGVEWIKGNTSTVTAARIAAAMDPHGEYSATSSSNVVTLVAGLYGLTPNSWTFSSSSPTAAILATSKAGQAYGYIYINGTTLTEGTDWTASGSNDVTVNSLEAAVNANATLSAIITASNTISGRLNLVSNVGGVNAYIVSVSSAYSLRPTFYTFTAGVATDVDLTDNYITETAHDLALGLAVLYSTASNKNITGLSYGTTYYVIPRTANTFKLASSTVNAVAGTAIDLTAVSGSGTYTFAPLAYANLPAVGFKFQGSNNGTTFYDVSVDSGPYNGADSGDTWSFTSYNYKWLRFKFAPPTSGAINYTVTVYGEK